ncbi:MAG: hypothetical protein CMP21_03960 [Rickettsiales bacterium]|nr:hypothetical protein [Rickettsiales bacterium]
MKEDVLVEAKVNKNLHLEHLEDNPLNFGYTGISKTIDFLNATIGLLSGSANKSVDVTVKYDGAPAIFCGTDPEDGKFFVGTKSVFSKNAKLVKRESDLDKYGFSGQLKDKLSIALKELPKLGIEGVLQGDMMFTSDDITTKKINGEPYITFQPNTIMYAVPSNSDLASKMLKSKIGIIFHTTYSGDKLEDMKASFGANVSKLNKVSSVWVDDAFYKDVTGSLFSEKETSDLEKKIAKLQRVGNAISKKSMNNILSVHDELKTSELGAGLKTYFNSNVRRGILPKSGVTGVNNFLIHFGNHFEDKVIAKVKQEKTKNQKKERKQQLLNLLIKEKVALANLLEFMLLTIDLKNSVIRKLETGVNSKMETFVVDNKGIRVTKPEGFVAIDKLSGGAVKFVDRLEFSQLNFTVDKNWSKVSS